MSNTRLETAISNFHQLLLHAQFLHREKWICCSNNFGTVDMPIVNRTTVFVESSDGVVEAKKPTSLGRQSKTVKVGLLLL